MKFFCAHRASLLSVSSVVNIAQESLVQDALAQCLPQRRDARRRRVWIVLPILMAGCTLYPTYERPEIATPEEWRTEYDMCNAAEIGWWKQFGDPVLDELIAQALANNQDLMVAIERVEQFRAQLQIASAKLYPQLNANGLAERERSSPETTVILPGQSPINNAFEYAFNFSYYLDFWGEVRSRSTAAYHELLASIESRRTVVLTLVSSVASSYFQLRQYDQQLQISKDTVADREEALYQAQIRFELGLTSQMPVEQAISEVEFAMIEIERLQIAIVETENLISLLLGQASSAIPRGRALDVMPMPPSIPAELPSDLVNQRPDIRAAEERLIAANARIGIARAAFFPQISLTGSYGNQSTQLGDLLKSYTSVWDYGATIFQEIFTGGRLMGDLAFTRAVQKEAIHSYLSTILTAFQEVNDAITTHKIYLDLVETQRVRVDALVRYLYLANLRYQEGQTDYLDFLDAERQLFQGQLDLEAAKGFSFVSYVQIYQALGGPWVTSADEAALSSTQMHSEE